MIISNVKKHRGRKARIGSLCFDEGRMMIFVGYYPFPDGTTRKILINLNEAREFANRIGAEKITIRTKIMRWIIKKYGN